MNLPGAKAHRPTSLVSPALQLVLAAALFFVAIWSYYHAPTVRATDQWVWNFLSAVTGLAALLFLPFAVVALGIRLRNRRRFGAAR